MDVQLLLEFYESTKNKIINKLQNTNTIIMILYFFQEFLLFLQEI